MGFPPELAPRFQESQLRMATATRPSRPSLTIFAPSGLNGRNPSGAGARLTATFGWRLLLAAAVLAPRSFLAARAHSESYDDDYHLLRGLAFWTRSIGTPRP